MHSIYEVIAFLLQTTLNHILRKFQNQQIKSLDFYCGRIARNGQKITVICLCLFTGVFVFEKSCDVLTSADWTILFYVASDWITERKVHYQTFADDITAAGQIDGLRKWWDELTSIGPPFGYFPKPSKSQLIVKPGFYDVAIAEFSETNLQIFTYGNKNLGAVIGSEAYKERYFDENVESLMRQINSSL